MACAARSPASAGGADARAAAEAATTDRPEARPSTRRLREVGERVGKALRVWGGGELDRR